jgi:LPS-assembly lipoprotein
MWWPKASSLRFPGILIGLLSLAGCGFHPLYGENAIDPKIAEEMASIRVDPIKDRQGQLIRNALVTALTPHGEPYQTRYHLQVLLLLTEGQEAISADTTSTRDVQNIAVTYRLYEGETAVAAGTFTQVYSFNFLQQHYSNVAALDDVRRHAGEDVAEEIHNRLANYFTAAKNHTVAPNPPPDGGSK